MEPLVQATDLAAFRGAPFDAAVVEAAAESVRAECEWHIAPSATDTVKVRAGGTVIHLDSMHVTGVASIVDNYGNTVEGWEWYPYGVIERPAGFPPFVTVTFTHGYESCPKELLPVIAERALSQAAGRIKSEALAGRSVSLEGGYDPATMGALVKHKLNGGP